MKKIVNKIVIGGFILGGFILINNNQSKNEFSRLIMKNLTVLNTANAETAAPSEKGPEMIRECGGMSTYHHTTCEGYNTTSCKSTPCTTN